MAAYCKKIAYLDYLENGMKIKNAGFLKLEENGGRIRLELRVKNAPEQFSGPFEICTDSGGKIGQISLNRGSGGCCMVWDKDRPAPEGTQQETMTGIYIRLPDRRLLQAVWEEPFFALTKRPNSAEQTAKTPTPEPEPNPEPTPEATPEPTPTPAPASALKASENVSEPVAQTDASKEATGQTPPPKRQMDAAVSPVPGHTSVSGRAGISFHHARRLCGAVQRVSENGAQQFSAPRLL